MSRVKEKTYWPHMIIGFLMMAVTLGYWTIRSASSMPVQESNTYMQKYQIVDMDINEILSKKDAFNKRYVIELTQKDRMVVTDNIHSNRVQKDQIVLKDGKNNFVFIIKDKINSNIVSKLDVNSIEFLLTRPHTKVDDILIEGLKLKDSKIFVDGINIKKKGRYTIQLRLDMKDGSIGYYETPAYLK